MMSQKVGNVAVIKSLTEGERVYTVRLLGYGKVDFKQYSRVLIINLPDQLPTPYVNTLEITI